MTYASGYAMSSARSVATSAYSNDRKNCVAELRERVAVVAPLPRERRLREPARRRRQRHLEQRVEREEEEQEQPEHPGAEQQPGREPRPLAPLVVALAAAGPQPEPSDLGEPLVELLLLRRRSGPKIASSARNSSVGTTSGLSTSVGRVAAHLRELLGDAVDRRDVLDRRGELAAFTGS